MHEHERIPRAPVLALDLTWAMDRRGLDFLGRRHRRFKSEAAQPKKQLKFLSRWNDR